MHADRSWCGTCGADCPAGEADCRRCKQWWHDNPPPDNEEIDESALSDDSHELM
jgi:hypothetical protein